MEVMKVEKAGMDGIDKERIAKIINENTNQNYSKYNAKKQSRIDARIAEIKEILENVSPLDMQRSQKEADELVAKLESTRDLNRHCVHIDMDAFFAAVEMRDAPRLRTIPMAVGSPSMLSTSNYIARRYGVRAAMPGFIALKLCPELEIVSGNYKQYSKESKAFAAVFREYDDNFSMGSLDEAYIDITNHLKNRNGPKKFVRLRFGGCVCRLPLFTEEENADNITKTVEVCVKCGTERVTYADEVEFGSDRAEVVNEIRFRIEQATGLTCSAGIANNFMLAKICSDFNKPNGQYELANDYLTIKEFLQVLPIRKVCGIGKVSEAHLKACGMETVGDIYEKRAVLKFIFSTLSQEYFIRVSLGVSGRSRDGDSRRKSISVERTFVPTSKEVDLRRCMQSICEELVSDIERATIIEILSSANNILTKELGQEMRLLGVRLSNLKFLDDRLMERTVPDFFKPKRQKLDDDVIDIQEVESEGSSSGPSSSFLESEPPTVECPVCKKRLVEDDTIVNQHLDECLNRDLIKPGSFFGSGAASSSKKSKVEEKTPNRKKKDVKTPKRSVHPITSFFKTVKD